MKILLITIGTVKDPSLQTLMSKYTARLPYYMPFEHVAVADVKQSRTMTPELQCLREADGILARIQPGDFVVLFDEHGRELTSRQLAEFIDRKAATLGRNLVFVIGGPYGFDGKVYARADMQLSLSKMTFTHEMAAMLATEQIYRAQTIIRGEPYHHD